MPHIPSFAIGCLFSGAAFLLVHQELSHRRRLTRKWEIREMAEEQVGSLMARVRGSSVAGETKKVSKIFIYIRGGPVEILTLLTVVQINSSQGTVTTAWNRGVSYIQDALRKET